MHFNDQKLDISGLLKFEILGEITEWEENMNFCILYRIKQFVKIVLLCGVVRLDCRLF